MHIVHSYLDGSLGGVLGIFFDVEDGVMNEQATQFIDSLQFANAVPDPGFELGAVNLADFLETVDMDKFWSYNGSLTTPLCTEGIKWTVVDDVQTISQANLDAIANLISPNNRAVQPLNDRTLYYVEMTGAITLAAASAIVSLLTF